MNGETYSMIGDILDQNITLEIISNQRPPISENVAIFSRGKRYTFMNESI